MVQKARYRPFAEAASTTLVTEANPARRFGCDSCIAAMPFRAHAPLLSAPGAALSGLASCRSNPYLPFGLSGQADRSARGRRLGATTVCSQPSGLESSDTHPKDDGEPEMTPGLFSFRLSQRLRCRRYIPTQTLMWTSK